MDLVTARRRLLMQQTAVPPTGYEFIEYAESDGTASVSLPFGFDYTDVVEACFVIPSRFKIDKYIVSPSQWNTNKNRYALGHHYNVYTAAFGDESTGGTGLLPNTIPDEAFHTWKYANKIFTMPDLGLIRNCTSIAFGSETANLKLFYGYSSNTVGSVKYYRHRKANGRLYNIVPIQNILDGTVEMYDTVSKTIMPRTGTLLAPT